MKLQQMESFTRIQALGPAAEASSSCRVFRLERGKASGKLQDSCLSGRKVLNEEEVCAGLHLFGHARKKIERQQDVKMCLQVICKFSANVHFLSPLARSWPLQHLAAMEAIVPARLPEGSASDGNEERELSWSKCMELCIYVYCGKPSPCNSDHEKSTRKSTRKSEKMEVRFPKVPASKNLALCSCPF